MKKGIVFICLLLTSLQLVAQQQKINLNKEQVAVEGYDVVAYFTENKAVKGNSMYQATDHGATYYFSSQKNKEAFEKNTSQYKPQYGGWCAYAIGKSGEYVEVDPKTFKIINHKLYLFYNKYLTNTLKLWNKEEATLLPNADKNWQTLGKK